MKRSFLRFLSIVGFVGLLFPSVALASFSDVPSTHEHYAAIEWMQARGVIEGYSDGTFRPDQSVTRAEALKIILVGTGVSLPETTENQTILYGDVQLDDWYFVHVQKATELGWVQGYSDGLFRPEQTINLAEALKIISIAKQIQTGAVTEDPYSDVPSAVWFSPYVSYAKTRNFIQAYHDGLLHPDYALTRGGLIEVLYRFLYTEMAGETTFDISMNWLENQHEERPYALKVPFTWEKHSGDQGEWILWYRDIPNSQTSWMRTYPNSAVISITIDTNEQQLSPAAYFEHIQNTLPWTPSGTISSEFNDHGYLTLKMEKENGDETLRDLYIALPNGQFALVHATYGHGALKEQLAQEVIAVASSLRHSEATPTSSVEEVLEQARAAIQVDGKGRATLDLFPDLSLIETDSIGVGTGPVDYYYSAWANVTLKYERSFDVLLDIQEGKTSAF